MFKEQLASLENRFFRFYSLTLALVFFIWGSKYYVDKEYFFSSFSFFVSLAGTIFYFLPFVYKKNKFILLSGIILSIIITFLFIFYYKFDSAVIYLIPIFLGIMMSFDYRKHKELRIIIILLAIIVIFAVFYYITFEMWFSLRVRDQEKLIPNIYDNVSCFFLAIGSIMFITKKMNLEHKEKIEILTGKDIIDNSCIQQLNNLIETGYDDFFYPFFESCYPKFINKVNNKTNNLILEEKKIIALLKLNYSTKEMAVITNSSVRSIEAKKYRIRKKMGISKEQNISIFFHEM